MNKGWVKLIRNTSHHLQYTLEELLWVVWSQVLGDLRPFEMEDNEFAEDEDFASLKDKDRWPGRNGASDSIMLSSSALSKKFTRSRHAIFSKTMGDETCAYSGSHEASVSSGFAVALPRLRPRPEGWPTPRAEPRRVRRGAMSTYAKISTMLG